MMKPHVPTALSLAGLGALNVYRAATQSFTIDEAFCFVQFTSQPWIASLIRPYDAANHVLFTLLSRPCGRMFENSEFALRLPVVIAGLLLLALVWVWTRRLFGDSWLMLPCALLVATQPLLLDLLSCARGYGLGAALWIAGFLLLHRDLDTETLARGGFLRSGVCFGLSVAANLMFVVPTAALLAAYLWMDTMADLTWPRAWLTLRKIDYLGTTAALVAGVLLVVPLSHSNPGNFYVGSKNVKDAFESVISNSIPPGCSDFVHWCGQYQRWFWIACLAGAAIYVLIALLRRRMDRMTGLVCGTTLVTALATVAAHVFVHVPYPYGRTALPLLLLALMSAGALLRAGASIPFFKPVWTACILLAVFCQVAALRVDRYEEWKFNADTRLMFSHMQGLVHDRRTPVRVCTTWLLEWPFDYYLQQSARQLPSVTRKPYEDGCDLVVLLPDDPHRAGETGRPVFTGPMSGATLYDRRVQRQPDSGTSSNRPAHPVSLR